jgi:hypothetical protein
MLKTVGNPASRTGDQTIIDGNLVIGTSGKGIDFSADPSAAGMTSELLDDYEEGTWTAVIKGFTTAGVYETQNNNCTYQKIGNRCFVQARIRMAGVLTGGGAGFAVVAGLPYSKSADSMPVGSVYFFGVDFVGDPFVGFYTFGSSSELNFGTNITTSGGEVAISGIAATDCIHFSIDYQVG